MKKTENKFKSIDKIKEFFSNRADIKRIIKTILIIFWSIFFVYQSSELISIYLSGKTVVENRIERLKHSQIPAITVCLPSFINMEKFANYYLKNSDKQEHLNFLDDFMTWKDSVNITSRNLTKEAREEQDRLFKYFVFKEYVKSCANITIKELFDNFVAELVMTNRRPFNEAFNESGDVVPLPLPIHVHSIVPFIEPRKCITIFSNSDEFYKTTKLNLIQLELLFEHNELAFPLSKYYNYDFYT